MKRFSRQDALRPHPVRESALKGSRWRKRYLVYFALLALLVAVASSYYRPPPSIPHPNLTSADFRFTDALGQAEAQVRRSPRDPEAWARLGAMLLAHAFPAEAQECFQRATELDETKWEWPYLEALAQRLEQPEHAVLSLERALQREPRAENPRLLCGELLIGLGRYQDAEAHFREIMKSSPRHPRASLGLARILFAQGESHQALEAVGPALAHPCTRRAAHLVLAQIQRRQGLPAAAAETLRTFQELPSDLPWPDDPLQQFESLRTDRLGYVARINNLRQDGAWNEARDVARQVEVLYPELHFLVEGNMKLEHGDVPSAELALRRALELKPQWVDALCSLGRALEQQQKFAEAGDTFRYILQIEPCYGPAYLELGRCVKQTDPQQARIAFQSAVAYMPLSAEAHQELGNMLASEGLTSEAQRHFRCAAHLGKNDN